MANVGRNEQIVIGVALITSIITGTLTFSGSGAVLTFAVLTFIVAAATESAWRTLWAARN